MGYDYPVRTVASWRRRVLLLLAVAALTALASGSLPVTPAAQVPRVQRSVVVCITNYQPPRGVYRIRPHTCELHHAGIYPIAGYNTVRGRSIHWRHWGRWNATGRGRIFLSTYGPAPARFRLSHPRTHCGANVF